MTRPQLLWVGDTTRPRADARRLGGCLTTPPPVPALRDYDTERKRRDAWALLGFCLDAHPMALHAEELTPLPPGARAATCTGTSASGC